MRFQTFAIVDLSEFALRGAGVGLAAASLVFAIHEASTVVDAPHIAGMEHLAIYARPTTRNAASAVREEKPGIDYTPVGSTRMRAAAGVLVDYEIVEASAGEALIRLPEGRVQRVTPGSRIAGLGRVLSIRQASRNWVVVTEAGALRQN